MTRLCLSTALALALAGATPASADDRPPPARPKIPRDAPQFTPSSAYPQTGNAATASTGKTAPKLATLPALIGGSGAPGSQPRTR